MGISILSNTSAMMSLSELNENLNKASKSQAKVATGLRINSAKDDASGYSISEKMLSDIRALNQDEENVQNASALLKIAAGGIDNIVAELRALKELAINAATDTNTDEDRRIIQKTFEQTMANIDDIASTTNYNGKHLLDGTYSRHMTEILVPVRVGGGAATTPADITDGFTAADGTSEITGVSTSHGGRYSIDHAYNGTSGTSNSLTQVYVDFTNLSLGGDVANSMSGKSFVILCSGCDQYVNIVFDGNKNNDQSEYNSNFSTTNSQARQYVIGIMDVTSLDDLPEAIYNGIKKYQTAANNSVVVDSRHDLRMAKTSDGRYMFTKEVGLYMEFSGSTVIDEEGNQTDVDNVMYEWQQVVDSYNPLVIHHGPKASESTNVFINDMHIKSLNSGLVTAKLTTRDNANNSIGIIQNALEYALNEATTVGAYQRRFEYTASNVVTMNENTQAAQSTIRDADMAREMTNYTKANVLSQAAQSMLAQANQLPAYVVSMLQ